MPTLDPVNNFAVSAVATAPSPPSSGTSLVLTTGDGALFPDPAVSGNYNIIIHPDGALPSTANAEIVRVTARTTDTLTITRAQEGTSARTVLVGDTVGLQWTEKFRDDLETHIDNTAAHGATGAVVGTTNTQTLSAKTLTSPIFEGNVNGWITETGAATRTGNYTFTLSGDVTSRYPKGTKIWYVDSGADEYGYVISSSYSAPNTTITLATNSDYAMAGNPSALYYSYAECPQGHPIWFTWVPTYTGFSTPPTDTNRFRIVGSTCIVIHNSGGLGTSNANTFSLTLPVAASGAMSAWRERLAYGVDNSAISATIYDFAYIGASQSSMLMLKNNSTTGWTASGSKGAQVEISYEF